MRLPSFFRRRPPPTPPGVLDYASARQIVLDVLPAALAPLAVRVALVEAQIAALATWLAENPSRRGPRLPRPTIRPVEEYDLQSLQIPGLPH